MLLGVFVFATCFIIYGYFRISGRLQSRPTKSELHDTSSKRLFRSKVHDAAFFDGESEDYTEADSRIRIFGGA